MRRDHHLQAFGAHLRESMACALQPGGKRTLPFDDLALELFQLQFEANPAYRRFCEVRGAGKLIPAHWTDIPSVPTSAFKEWELTCIPVEERTRVFLSSGTTEQRPSRHFHNQNSLAIYETSLVGWFAAHFPSCAETELVVSLTPDSTQAPHSSLVHMFETVRRQRNARDFVFVGEVLPDGSWRVDCLGAIEVLCSAEAGKQPVLLLGTAFSYVHLLDHLEERGLRLNLAAGSRVLETGGYKGRSRALPKHQLHALITDRLGVLAAHILCEYGMSELSSQAYDRAAPATPSDRPVQDGFESKLSRRHAGAPRDFHFPPWARVQLISPETGREVAEGETGLIRVFDLANVYSVLAIQTEDLAIRRGTGFELIGRASMAEPRGCSLMAG